MRSRISSVGHRRSRFLRVDGAGRDRVHTDAVLRPLDGERARQIDDSGLRGGRMRRARPAGPGIARDDVDDLRVVAAAVDHAAGELSRAVERPVEDDPDDGPPAVRRELLGPHVEVAGRVVDERRDRTELRFGDVEGLGDGVRLAHVRGNGDSILELRDRLLEHMAPAPEHRDLCAEASQLERHCTAKPATAARDERDAARERSLGEHQVSSSL